MYCTLFEADFCIQSVQGTVSRDFRHILLKKTPPGPHLKRQKRFCKIVVDYAGMMSA